MPKKTGKPPRSAKSKQARAKAQVTALFLKGTARGAGSSRSCTGACEQFCKQQTKCGSCESACQGNCKTTVKPCAEGVQCGACFSLCQSGGCKTGCKMSCQSGCELQCQTIAKGFWPTKDRKPAKRKAGAKK